MKILAIIPARGGSKGLPRKNVLPLCGKPMIAYAIEPGRASKYVDRVIVSTEDEEIAAVARDCGAEVPFMRPAELAQDATVGIEPVLYTVKRLQEDGYNPDYVLLLQPTSPLRETRHLNEAIASLLEKQEEFDSLVSLTKLEHPVEWNRLIGEGGKLSDFIAYSKEEQSVRQRAKEVYRLNGAIYIAKTQALVRCRSFETARTLGYVMDSESSVDIDTRLDFQWAEFLLEQRQNHRAL